MIDPGLTGKVALVTGANNPLGIGAAIAEGLAAQGASVFITYLQQQPEDYGIATDIAASATTPGEALYRAGNAAPADEVLHRLRKHEHGSRAATGEFDLAVPDTIPLLFNQVERELGPVEVLIANAAHSTSDTFVPAANHDWAGRGLSSVDAASHDRHFAVNSRAAALLIAEFARRHVERAAAWGRIITISTDGADRFPGEISYGASKAALESYSRTAATELGRFGITVNIVSPGPIQTGWIPEESLPEIAAGTPLGRVGAPQDVADVVVFLASEQARWVTGQRLWVGGGHRM
jgi:3-oxoacyl-[acyl-carrier protein] reductase